MSRLGIWATDVEISAAATFLQTDVFVHTQVNPTMSKWLRYQPLTKISLSKYWKIQNKEVISKLLMGVNDMPKERNNT